jgi:NADPH2:quinone reductase
MAKAVGASVATTASTAEKAAFCRATGADHVFNHNTEEIPARLRESFESGVDVWYETQREPDLDTSNPLLNRRGRMNFMPGRTARRVLHLGSLYTRNGSLLGFAMFNAFLVEQRHRGSRSAVRPKRLSA